MNHIMRRAAGLTAGLAILVSTLGGTAFADNQPAAVTSSSTVAITLPANGGWAAYTFPYVGTNVVDKLTLTYTPADTFSDQHLTLTAYAPGVVPAGNNSIGAATLLGDASGVNQPGVKTWQLSAIDPGTYTVIVQNWDDLGRPITAHVATSDVASGNAGPALTKISSSSNVVSVATSTDVAPTPAPATPVASTPAPTAPSANKSSASVSLQPNGGWATYTFNYPGDSSELKVTLTYNPADQTADNDFTLTAYAPGVVPGASNSIGAATVYHDTAGNGNSGLKTWQLNSTTSGTYTLFLQNWDNQGRTIGAQISTSEVSTGADGPALTLVASGH